MSIYGDLTKFNQDSLIELFVLDLTSRGDTFYYFHAGTNEFKQDIIWQGQTYQPLPIQASGFEASGERFARPKLQVANSQGIFSALVKPYKDLVNCPLIRKRTTARYLDAANFVGGNPHASPTDYFPDDVFYIRRKTLENRVSVEWELGTATDLAGVELPKNKVNAVTCRWQYRGEGCQYTGLAVATAQDTPTSDMQFDKCSGSVTGCKFRFGEYGVLNFGGYPGAALLQF